MLIIGLITTIIALILWNFLRINSTNNEIKKIIDYNETPEESEIIKLEKYLLKNPKDIPSLFNLSQLYLQKNRYKDALNNLEIILKQNLSDMKNLKMETLILASDSYSKIDNLELEEAYLFQAFKIDETNIKTVTRMVKKLYDKGDYDSALDLSKNIITLYPEILDGHYYHGMSNYQKDNLDIAFKSLNNALQIKPNDFDISFTMAKIHEKKNEHENALIHINNALKSTKDDNQYAEVLYHKGSILNKTNEFDKSKDTLTLALKRTTDKLMKILILDLLIEIEKKGDDICNIVFLLKDYLAINPNNETYVDELQHYIELKANTMFQKFEKTCGASLADFCLNIVKIMRPIKEICQHNIRKDNTIEISIITESEEEDYKEVVWCMRNSTTIGVVPLMDILARMKETSAKECTIVCNTNFNVEAKKYAQTRMINLVEKNELINLLNKMLDMSRLAEK